MLPECAPPATPDEPEATDDGRNGPFLTAKDLPVFYRMSAKILRTDAEHQNTPPEIRDRLLEAARQLDDAADQIERFPAAGVLIFARKP